MNPLEKASPKICVRCGRTDEIEEDHIVPRSRGGNDEDDNKRFLCKACHDYRHARDNIDQEIRLALDRLRLGHKSFSKVELTMWIFRLGILEAFNTPEMIRERKSFRSYWEESATHYSRWYPQMKFEKLAKDQKQLQKQLLEEVKHDSAIF
jgi:hypothetical protein